MLPPILEFFVVWHPDDAAGAGIAQEFVEHFHGSAFTGLIGGAVEVFVRSEGWRAADDAPRPITCLEAPKSNDLQPPAFVAVVPLMGTEMAAAVQSAGSLWRGYIEELVRLCGAAPNRIAVFPYLLDAGALDQTELGRLLSGFQRIAATAPDTEGDTLRNARCRDLAQGVAQFIAAEGTQRITAFISHTKKALPGGEEDSTALIASVRDVIQNTRLQEFFDASDLQPGENWDAEIRSKAATSALLAIRTDLYPSHEWCQREILIAKQNGMPIVIMDALGHAEERGSFLMDHVPRVPIRLQGDRWSKADIYRALDLLVDECLKRALWIHQERLSSGRPELQIAWWAPHAPEPLTLVQWIESARRSGALKPEARAVRILHPDPPLGRDEKLVLDQVFSLTGSSAELDIMTPRLLAARGG